MEIYKNLSLEDLDGEIWKEIEEYNGDYQISNFGRVKSFKRKDSIILKQEINNSGYLYIKLCKDGKCKHNLIHILEFENFNKKLECGECIHHINENKYDNNLNNLKSINKKEHKTLHQYGKKCPEHSKRMSGEKHPQSILIEQDVIKIKILLKESKLTQKDIGKLFGVNQTTISDIKTGKRWTHIKVGE